VQQGELIGANWGRLLVSGKHLDPYLVWADVTRFAGFGGWPGPTAEHDGHWPFVLEIEPGVPLTLPPCAGPVDDVFCELKIPGLYVVPSDNRGSPRRLKARFVTARVLKDSVARLLSSPSIKRMQLGLPRLPAPAVERAATKPFLGDVRRVVIGIIDDGCAFAHPALGDASGATRVHFLWDQDSLRRPDPATGWQDPVRVNYGAELRHQAMTAASREALRCGAAELAYRRVNYGPVRLDPERNSTMFRFDSGGARFDLPVGTMLASTHGSGATFLAAGVTEAGANGRPLHWQRALSTSPDAAAAAAARSDHATHWPIVFVQLPTRTILDTSGGSLGVHVLDGIHYILDRADSIPFDEERGASGSDNPAQDPDLPRVSTNHRVVINVSYGATAGPHDGSSIVEQAMAGIVGGISPETLSTHGSGYRENTWICVAAGNAHGAQTHARLSLPRGGSKVFEWQVGADNPLQSFVEIWLPDVDRQGATVRDARLDRITVHVTPPGGASGQRVCRGQAYVWSQAGTKSGERDAVAGALFSNRVAQGLRGTMILVAVAATRPDGAARPAPHGRWLIEVADESGSADAAGADDELVVHAWVERNDLLFGNRRGQQGRVFGDDPVPEPTEFNRESKQFVRSLRGVWPNWHLVDQLQGRPSFGTLSGAARDAAGAPFYKRDVASGSLVVVGGHRLADRELAPYSSGGPHRLFADRSTELAVPVSNPTMPEYAPTRSAPRNRPDVTAPSDVGTAMRGLRVMGMLPGVTSRLSGTSAAAPSVARAIANFQWDRINNASNSEHPAQFGITRDPAPTGDPDPSRPTPTPRKDDRHRRGDWKVE
jgi:hypothetical protein